MSRLFSFTNNIPILRLLLLCSFLLCSACSNVQSVIYDGLTAGSNVGLLSNHKVKRTNNWVLPMDSSFYVAFNIEGVDSADFIGVKVADLIQLEISKRFPEVVRASDAESLDYAQNSARLSQMDYLVYPKIFIWRDTPGTWTELGQLLRGSSRAAIVDEVGLDKLMLQLVLMEASTGRVVDIASIESQSGLLTLYESSPQSLLAAGVGQYIESLQRY